jgi:hypothetical protein
LQINVYKQPTGLSAAAALIENAQLMPITINISANGLAASEIR